MAQFVVLRAAEDQPRGPFVEVGRAETRSPGDALNTVLGGLNGDAPEGGLYVVVMESAWQPKSVRPVQKVVYEFE